ncbi:hypothetical protein SAMN02745121_07982 [Nannocystis exedens]|uniref:Uncharacterized protein n=1 Tax=Nannocystis exedens TaxID=54 RepID=A0A1I2HIA2_9BACT|nr:DUF6624 domain-containing protein [Nannocystis exedens]PCC74158.1 hypothetical protein NAEX_07247 [Nannocystis exedens]SFF29422.1 hypothetical protein SAMN02745121_07982 [Nannocystis exedens]
MDEELRNDLIRWIAEDDETRERLARDGSLFAGYHPEMEAVHRRNAARLREVLARVGWPGRALVGEDGASAAWRIVQHAIGEPALLRGCLPLLQAAAAEGDADPAEVAMLEDRIRVSEGRPQRYGTQYDWSDDGTAMVPMVGVEAPESLAERRAAVGLPPMVWRRPPPPGESPPADRAARQAEMEAWARRVGWR